MFEGRTDDLDRLLVQARIPSEDLDDLDKREGLLISGGSWRCSPGAGPLWTKTFLISCSFFVENLVKLYVGAPGRLAAPLIENPGSASDITSHKLSYSS